MRPYHSISSLAHLLIQKAKSEYPTTIHGGTLERYGMDAQYKGGTVGRCCRLLVEEGYLKATYNEKHHVMYQFIPVKEQQVIFNKDNSVTIT